MATTAETSKTAQEKRHAFVQGVPASGIRLKMWLARSPFTRHIWASRSNTKASCVR